MILNKLAKYHTEWIKMVKSLGGDDFTEDIVQEMYLKVYNKNYNVLNDKGDINKYYVYLTLKSILMSYFVQRSKVRKVEIKECVDFENYDDIEEEEAYNKFSLKVDEEINKWYWYDREVFDLYRFTNLSIRDIGKQTGISFVSIFHTLKDCKKKIKDNLQKDYEQYKKS